MMNYLRVLLISVMLLSVGVIVLPSTVSLFHGQHIWYNISGNGNNIPCRKCHADVYEEMRTTIGPHTGETGYVFDCQLCHRATGFNGIQYATVNQSTYTSAYPGVQAHAASVVECMACHGAYGTPYVLKHVTYYGSISPTQTCSQCHGTPWFFGTPVGAGGTDYVQAGGFGLTSLPGDTGSMAAHLMFVKQAIASSTMPGANEACVACHTETPVNITWHHAEYLRFSAKYNWSVWKSTNYSTHYLAFNYSAGGNYTVYVLGNATGFGVVKLTNGSYFYANGTLTTTAPSSKVYPGYLW